MPQPNTEADFWRQVKQGDGCWLWTGARPSGRYGRFKIGGQRFAAHRFSWLISFGAIPAGSHVLHRCDDPACVRPDHLFIGTHADNMADKASKGRVVALSGEANANARLSDELVRDIRARHARGEKQTSIAAALGMHQGNVSRIVLRKAWKHI